MISETHEKTLLDRVTFGFWVYILSDCVLFAGLFAVYAVLHDSTFGGPSIDVITNLPYVLLETIVLLASSFTCGLAVLAAHENKKAWTENALLATILLGLFFVGMEVNEFAQLIMEGHSWQISAFLSSFFALLGTHGLHVFSGCVWMGVLFVHMRMRGLSPGNVRKLMCLSLFWHFLDIVWIFIFTFVYLFGAL